MPSKKPVQAPKPEEQPNAVQVPLVTEPVELIQDMSNYVLSWDANGGELRFNDITYDGGQPRMTITKVTEITLSSGEVRQLIERIESGIAAIQMARMTDPEHLERRR